MPKSHTGRSIQTTKVSKNKMSSANRIANLDFLELSEFGLTWKN
jgi:hypothetical protein